MFTNNKMSILEKIMKKKEEKFVSSLDDLRDDQDSTICIFIPYEKFLYCSFSEIEYLKEKASLSKFNKDLFLYVASKYNINHNQLYIYWYYLI